VAPGCSGLRGVGSTQEGITREDEKGWLHLPVGLWMTGLERWRGAAVERRSSAEQSRDADVVDRGAGSTAAFPRRRQRTSCGASFYSPSCPGARLLLLLPSSPLLCSLSALFCRCGGGGREELGALGLAAATGFYRGSARVRGRIEAQTPRVRWDVRCGVDTRQHHGARRWGSGARRAVKSERGKVRGGLHRALSRCGAG